MAVSSIPIERVPPKYPPKAGVPTLAPWPTRRDIWNQREARREVELMLSGRGSEYQYQPMPERWTP